MHATLTAEHIKDDFAFYELKKSDTSFKNQVQNCMTIMKIPKADRSDKMFQKYDVKYGIRIYSSDEDTAPKILGQSTAEIPLKAPKYKTKRFDEAVGLPTDIDFDSKTLKSESIDVAANTLTDFSGITKPAKLTMETNYIAIKSTSMADVLEFNFKTEIESGKVADNEFVAAYFAYRKKGSSDTF